MTPFIKNHRPPTYYGVKLPATWDSHTMWRCTRHIPSSKVYPAFMEMCPSCKQPRPPEEFRPADPYAPPAAPVTVVTPPSDKCPKCGREKRRDLGDQYIMYPKANTPIDVRLYCGDEEDGGCGHEWSVSVVVRVTLEGPPTAAEDAAQAEDIREHMPDIEAQ